MPGRDKTPTTAERTVVIPLPCVATACGPRAAQAVGHHRGERLRRPVGTKEILRDQLRYLQSLSHRPNFTLQIIPAGMTGHAVPSGFTILRFSEPDLPDVACLEHLTSALYFDKKSEVDRYLLAIERLSIVAAKPHHTPGILTAIIDELEEEL